MLADSLADLALAASAAEALVLVERFHPQERGNVFLLPASLDALDGKAATSFHFSSRSLASKSRTM